MKSLNAMIKPSSSLCNMRCKYCFYADVSDSRKIKSCGIMTDDVMNIIVSEIYKYLDDGDHVQFIFQGGEPTLAGLSFYNEFIYLVKNQQKKVNVSYSLQTNAILIDESWCEFLKENNFLVGVSLDILPECHDKVRVDAEGSGTYKRIEKAIRLLDKYKIDYNVLCTLTNEIARYPKKVWNKLVSLGIKYVQFTPCLGELNEKSTSQYALTPERFSSFYAQLFRLWLEAYKNGQYISVKLFEDILNLMVIGKPTSCGMNGICQPQLVIEADGSVYPCDFYCIDEYKLGNLKEQGIAQLLNNKVVGDFINRPHKRPELCEGCQYFNFCGGNCKRMQKEICCSGNDKYCGYRDFLYNCGNEFNNIAREITYKKYRR